MTKESNQAALFKASTALKESANKSAVNAIKPTIATIKPTLSRAEQQKKEEEKENIGCFGRFFKWVNAPLPITNTTPAPATTTATTTLREEMHCDRVSGFYGSPGDMY